MSSDDEKAAIYARLYDCIKGKEPGWQEESLGLFLSKASEPPAPEYKKTVERVAESGPPATPPVIYLPSAGTSGDKFLSVPDTQAIGRGVDTGELLSISDTARRSGLYILGRSGSGKTELLKRMILGDIDHGHGIFFVDPHGDAIDDLITRLPAQRIKDVISIDPDLESYSFGINLLSCNNIASWSEREATYNRAKAVFDKLWKNMPEELP